MSSVTIIDAAPQIELAPGKASPAKPPANGTVPSSSVASSKEGSVKPDATPAAGAKSPEKKKRPLEVNRELYVALYGSELINQGGIMLQLSQVVIATAQVLYHRFYRGVGGKPRNIKEFPPFLVAMACIYLSTKVEEEKRRHRDILNVFDRLQKKRHGRPLHVLDPYGKRYNKWRNYLMKLELVILCDLGYMLKFEHPHKYILNYINVLDADEKVAQKAWSFLNDSLRLPQIIDIKPEVLACAAIFLAARHLQLKLPENPPWYSLFQAEKDEVHRVADMIMMLYKIPRHRFEKMSTGKGEDKVPEEDASAFAEEPESELLKSMKLPKPPRKKRKKTDKDKEEKSKKEESRRSSKKARDDDSSEYSSDQDKAKDEGGSKARKGRSKEKKDKRRSRSRSRRRRNKSSRRKRRRSRSRSRSRERRKRRRRAYSSD